MNKKFSSFIISLVDRAATTAGMITVFISMAAFGLGSLFVNANSGLYVGIIAFGIAGAYEVAFRQRKAEARQRSKRAKPSDIIPRIVDVYPDWHLKILQEFKHGGFIFRSMGFEEIPVPLAIAGPLCPVCKKSLAVRVHVSYFLKVRFTYICACGLNLSSPLSEDELRQEAADIANLPK